jgi:hypothetical protein
MFPMQVEAKKIYSAPKKYILCLFNWNKKCDVVSGFGTKISEINQCPFKMKNMSCVNCEPILSAEDFEYKYPKTEQRSKKRTYINHSDHSDQSFSKRTEMPELENNTLKIKQNKRELTEKTEKIQVPSSLVRLDYRNEILQLQTPKGNYRIHLDQIKMQLTENYPIAPKTISEILDKFSNKLKKPETFTYQSVLYQYEVYAFCKDDRRVIFVISAETKIEYLYDKNMYVIQEINIPHE